MQCKTELSRLMFGRCRCQIIKRETKIIKLFKIIKKFWEVIDGKKHDNKR